MRTRVMSRRLVLEAGVCALTAGTAAPGIAVALPDTRLNQEGCWDTQNTFIERLDLKRISGAGNDAFVLYVGRTTNGKTFRNVEYLRLRDKKVMAIECYFGAQNNFPSAVSGR
jgi:hypothetical protein